MLRSVNKVKEPWGARQADCCRPVRSKRSVCVILRFLDRAAVRDDDPHYVLCDRTCLTADRGSEEGRVERAEPTGAVNTANGKKDCRVDGRPPPMQSSLFALPLCSAVAIWGRFRRILVILSRTCSNAAMVAARFRSLARRQVRILRPECCPAQQGGHSSFSSMNFDGNSHLLLPKPLQPQPITKVNRAQRRARE